MKRFLWLAVLMLTVLGGWAPAHGQQGAIGTRPFNGPQVLPGGGFSKADTTRQANWYEGQSLVTTEGSPFYDQNVERLIITNSALAAGGADSCLPFDNHRNTLGMLALKIVPTWAAQTVADYAVQVRYHYLGASDTSSVFPIMPVRQAAAADSATFGKFGQYFNGSSVLPYPSEFVVHLAKANIVGGYAYPQKCELAIALPQYYGLGVCPTYISIRVRNINGPVAKLDVYYTSAP